MLPGADGVDRQPVTSIDPHPVATDGDRAAGDRLDRRIGWVTFAAAVVLVVAGLGQSLLGLRVFASSDVVYRVAPWSAQVPPGFSAENDYVQDPIDAVLPGAYEFVSRLRDGDVAQWSDLQSGGFEVAATPNLALYSPLTAPYVVLPLWLAPAYGKLLEIVVTIGGMVLFTRRLGLGRAAGWMGGLAFATSGFMVAWTNWPQTRVAAFVPALFWALERLLQTRNGRSVALVAAVVGAMLAGGFPAVTTYALYTGAAYVLVRLVVLERHRLARLVTSGGLAIAGVAAGALLVAVQLLPFLDLLGQTYVGPRDQDAENFLPLASLVTMLAPDAMGTTNARIGWLGPRNPIESFSYAGVAVVLLAGIGMITGFRAARAEHRDQVSRRGVRTFLIVATLVWGVAIYAGGPWLTLLQRLPFLDMNPIGRARSVLGFLVAVLAAVGFDALLRSEPVQVRLRELWRGTAGERRARAARAIAWALLAGATVALIAHGLQYAVDGGFYGYYGTRIMIAAGLGVAALVGVILARTRRGGWRLAGLVLVPAVVLGQAIMVVVPFWPEVPREDFYPVTDTHRFLAANIGHDRYLAADDALMPGSNVAYGLRSLSGHAFMRESFAELLRAVDPDAFVAPTLAEPSVPSAVAGAALLDRLGVTYLVSPPESEVAGVRTTVGGSAQQVVWTPGSTLRFELDGGPLRGVGVALAETPSDLDVPARVEARVVDQAGAVELAGARLLRDRTKPGDVVVALAGEDVAASRPLTIELTLRADHTVLLAGSAGVPQLVVVRPGGDSLEMLRSDEAVVYEREDALPRIRWAGTSAVEPDGPTAIGRMLAGEEADVLLAEPGPEADGSSAAVEVLEDSGDTIRVRVDADGAGYVVVADALQDSFRATLDGEPVQLRAADHAVVAVATPAGEHEIMITYDAPRGGAGLIISIATAVALVLLVLINPGRARTRRSSPPRTDAR